jgi:hypothetical protein
MSTPRAIDVSGAAQRRQLWLGVTLLSAGFLGHLLAARAIGGSFVAYRDHIAGFFILSLVSGAIIERLGRRFWRGRYDITILALGALQALLGFVVYLRMFHIG